MEVREANKRARREGGMCFASPPARKSLAFDDTEDASERSKIVTTIAFDTPRAVAQAERVEERGEGSGASTATPLLKRKARTARAEGVDDASFLTPFARALSDASNGRCVDGGQGGAAAMAAAAASAMPCRPLASPPPMATLASPPAPPRKLALGQNMSYGYTPSRGDTRYDASQRVDYDEPETPALAGSCALIPSALDAALGLPTIDGATLRGLMSSHDAELVVIDCRFPYEYSGGRARGALNFYLPHDVQRFLASRASISANTVYVFYCEFSSERAPRMWRHVRNLDRRDHIANYPSLSFPHTYVLAGGFSKFYEQHPDCCEGQMISMSDSRFTNLCREYVTRSREVWHVAQRATSLRHIPSDQDLIATARASNREVQRRGAINFDEVADMDNEC